MPNRYVIPLAFLLLADADVPRINNLRAPDKPSLNFPSDEQIPVFPSSGASSESEASQSQLQTKSASVPNQPLQESTKLTLIRFVSGEFAKAVKALPAGKQGFDFSVGQPLKTELLDRAVASHGAAINSGDSVQITGLQFRGRQIIVDINGGGRGKHHWRDHLQIGIGGPYPTMSSSTQETGPPGLQPGMGSTIFLEWNKFVPDMTPEELKQVLAPFLNFQKERSASVQWIDTLPPETKKAIQERRPMVGMDREELVAAMGKPDHKVRERDSDGNDIEDWIYGQPPSKTIFVRFTGDHVTKIEQFPQ
ncbi:MAG: hypothetical protein DMG38_05555 [Acidobacteria bacterium]|nr:MAG: hypothetical protein DMG38_05555 [Acidobacteriota bacterium]